MLGQNVSIIKDDKSFSNIEISQIGLDPSFFIDKDFKEFDEKAYMESDQPSFKKPLANIIATSTKQNESSSARPPAL